MSKSCPALPEALAPANTGAHAEPLYFIVSVRETIGRIDVHTHPNTTAACAAGVVTKTTDRDSLRYIPTIGPEGCAS